MSRSRLLAVLQVCLALLLLAPSAQAVEDKVIVVTDSPTQRFDPQILTIQAGTRRPGRTCPARTTLSPATGGFTSGSPAAAPWTFSHTFDSAGKFSYSCAAH